MTLLKVTPQRRDRIAGVATLIAGVVLFWALVAIVFFSDVGGN